ncbi:MAG: proton-conducting transporter membrane subunit, partial [Pseudomonadota bacterium]
METAAVLLPLVGAILAGAISITGRRNLDAVAMGLTVGAMVIATMLSIWLFIDVALGHDPRTIILFTWIDSGALEINWALKIDTLTAVMLVVVNGVSCLVHIYSIGYMSHDKYRPRFFAYLSLFTFMMLMLVTADNFVQLFFGWEGVGLASYLLIGYYMERPSAGAASIKAFLVNRVGDFGLSLGIFTIFILTGSVQFDQVFAVVPDLVDETFIFLGMEFHALTLACILLFVGAMGKSAQLGLHTWLPDAMEGPTPVSALIHA